MARGRHRRRHLRAIVVTDLVDSTGYLLRHGLDRAQEHERRHKWWLRSAAETYEGLVTRDTGDGMYLSFATVEDALDFAEAARLRVASLAVGGEKPRLHLGLAVGTVAVGDEPWAEPTAVAKRLCESARPDQLLATAQAAEILGEPVADRLRTSGKRRIGQFGEVRVAEAVWRHPDPLDVPLRRELTDLWSIPARGRRTEIDRVEDLLLGDDLPAAVVVVVGEPGIGKTKVLAEVALRSVVGGRVVAFAPCRRRDAPLGPIADVVHQLLTSVDDAASFALFSSDPAAADLIGRLRSRSWSLDGVDDDVVVRVAVRLVAHVLERRALVLILDGLDRADAAVGRALERILTSDRRGLAVVAAARQGIDCWAADLDLVAAELAAPIAVVELGRLDTAAVRDLVEDVTGDGDDGLWADVVTLSAGVPGHAVHLARHRAEGRLGLPSVVVAGVAETLQGLDDETRTTLELAACVHDDRITVDLLSDALDRPSDVVFDDLELAVAHHLLIAHPLATNRFDFDPPVVREAIYQNLHRSGRARHHRRLLTAYEAAGRSPGAGLLAHHAERAADLSETEIGAYCAAAGEEAVARRDFVEAARWCALAVEHHPTGRDETAVTRLIALGANQRRAGLPECEQTLDRAFATARQLDDRRLVAEAVLALNVSQYRHPERVTTAVIDRVHLALDGLRPGDDNLRARLLAMLAHEKSWMGAGSERFDLADAALAAARRSGDRAVLADVLLARQATIVSPHTLEDRGRGADELLRLADELHDPGLQFWAAFHLSGANYELGWIEQAYEYVARAERLAAQLDEPYLRWHVGYMLAATKLANGELDRAEELADKACRIGLQADTGGNASRFHIGQLLEIRRWQDRLGELVGLYPATGQPDVDLGLVLSASALDAGRHDDAHRGLLLAERLGRGVWPRRVILGLAEACNAARLAAHFGHLRLGARLYNGLLVHRSCHAKTIVGMCQVEYYLGVLAAALGRDRITVDAHFSVAHQTHDEVYTPLLLGEVRLAWGGALLGTDPARGRNMLGETISLADRHHAPWLRRRAEELLDGDLRRPASA
ncbi:MAG: AAA family ATPase [Acidimicrobiales bacterium]